MYRCTPKIWSKDGYSHLPSNMVWESAEKRGHYLLSLMHIPPEMQLSRSFLSLSPWLPCFAQTTRHSWNQGQAAGPARLPLFWLIVISPSCVFNVLIDSLFRKQIKASLTFIHSFRFMSFSCEFTPCVIMLDHV